MDVTASPIRPQRSGSASGGLSVNTAGGGGSPGRSPTMGTSRSTSNFLESKTSSRRRKDLSVATGRARSPTKDRAEHWMLGMVHEGHGAFLYPNLTEPRDNIGVGEYNLRAEVKTYDPLERIIPSKFAPSCTFGSQTNPPGTSLRTSDDGWTIFQHEPNELNEKCPADRIAIDRNRRHTRGEGIGLGHGSVLEHTSYVHGKSTTPNVVMDQRPRFEEPRTTLREGLAEEPSIVRKRTMGGLINTGRRFPYSKPVARPKQPALTGRPRGVKRRKPRASPAASTSGSMSASVSASDTQSEQQAGKDQSRRQQSASRRGSRRPSAATERSAGTKAASKKLPAMFRMALARPHYSPSLAGLAPPQRPGSRSTSLTRPSIFTYMGAGPNTCL